MNVQHRVIEKQVMQTVQQSVYVVELEEWEAQALSAVGGGVRTSFIACVPDKRVAFLRDLGEALREAGVPSHRLGAFEGEFLF